MLVAIEFNSIRSMTLKSTYNIGMVLNDEFMAQYWRILSGSSLLDSHYVENKASTRLVYLTCSKYLQNKLKFADIRLFS